jgi:small subunit ribosomal protein S6
MREYETTFIVQPEISDEGIQAICERLEGILDKNGATRLFIDDMGRRRLAYEIRNFQKGQYLTLFFLDEGKVVPELERSLRLDDSVLRFLTVLASEEVADVEARKAEAVEIERIRAEKAAERAAREAEDAARAAEEAARVAEEAAAQPQDQPGEEAGSEVAAPPQDQAGTEEGSEGAEAPEAEAEEMPKQAQEE